MRATPLPGNNSFCEALYFGVPSIVMPYCWDGHDNARRAEESGVGLRLDRYRWDGDQLRGAIETLLANNDMQARLKANALRMQAAGGAGKAAAAILEVVAEDKRRGRRAS